MCNFSDVQSISILYNKLNAYFFRDTGGADFEEVGTSRPAFFCRIGSQLDNNGIEVLSAPNVSYGKIVFYLCFKERELKHKIA